MISRVERAMIVPALNALGRIQATVFAGYQLAFAGIVILLGWLLLTEGYTAGSMAAVLLPPGNLPSMNIDDGL